MPNSEVYLIEAKYNPEVKKVNHFLNQIELFKNHIPTSQHFKTVTKIQPILCVKQLKEDVKNLCNKKGIWTIQPNGLNYTIKDCNNQVITKINTGIRKFSTLIRKIKF